MAKRLPFLRNCSLVRSKNVWALLIIKISALRSVDKLLIYISKLRIYLCRKP